MVGKDLKWRELFKEAVWDERSWGLKEVQYLMVKGNEQKNVKETKKENLERCRKNMISLKLIENCGFKQENEQL